MNKLKSSSLDICSEKSGLPITKAIEHTQKRLKNYAAKNLAIEPVHIEVRGTTISP